MRTESSFTASYRLRAGYVLPALIFLSACHGTAYQIATIQNNIDYKLARFHEDCGTPVKCEDGAGSCPARCTALNADVKAAHEAAAALKNGGGLPLQMKALKAADKAAK